MPSRHGRRGRLSRPDEKGRLWAAPSCSPLSAARRHLKRRGSWLFSDASINGSTDFTSNGVATRHRCYMPCLKTCLPLCSIPSGGAPKSHGVWPPPLKWHTAKYNYLFGVQGPPRSPLAGGMAGPPHPPVMTILYTVVAHTCNIMNLISLKSSSPKR